MNTLTKNLLSKVNKTVDNFKDSYVQIIGGTLAVSALYAWAGIRCSKRGHKASANLMYVYCGTNLTYGAKMVLEKYQRDNRKNSILSKEVIDEVIEIDGNPQRLQEELDKRTVATYRNYPIVVWDEYVAVQLSTPIDSSFNVICLYEKNTIILSSAAYDMKREVLEAIFEHEIGHIELGHSRDDADQEKIEMEADQYAFEQGKDIIGALKVLKRSGVMANFKYGKFFETSHISQRIAAARRLV